MSAKHAVLGLVIERPGYGYDLAQRLDQRCGSWGWEPTGVYGALDSLARSGHVRSRGAKRPRAPGRAAPRLVYEATPEGLDFFSAWMHSTSTPKPIRQELDLKLLFSSPEFLPDLIDQTWSHEQHCLNQLSKLTSGASQPTQSGLPGLSELAHQLHTNAEVRLLQARIEWLHDVRDSLSMYLESTSSYPERRSSV
jgi:DNA-binding PadR family transcriptional regulator